MHSDTQAPVLCVLPTCILLETQPRPGCLQAVFSIQQLLEPKPKPFQRYHQPRAPHQHVKFLYLEPHREAAVTTLGYPCPEDMRGKVLLWLLLGPQKLHGED